MGIGEASSCQASSWSQAGDGGAPPCRGVLLERAADVLVGTAGWGQFGVTQSLLGAFTAVGGVGDVQGAVERGGDQALDGQSLSSSIQELLPPFKVWRLLGRAGLGSGPTAEAAFHSSVLQTGSVASAPTSKPSSSSPARDSLTPGPGPSSAIPLRPPPAKAPSTDTVSECPGTHGVSSAVTAPWGWGGGRQDPVCHRQSWLGRFAPQNHTYESWPRGAPLPLPHTGWAQTCRVMVGVFMVGV